MFKDGKVHILFCVNKSEFGTKCFVKREQFVLPFINVRELQHTMERVVILGDGSLLKPENFQFHATPKQKKEEETVLNLEQIERQTIEKAMKLSEGNISRAAEYLGITRFALYRKLEKLGL